VAQRSPFRIVLTLVAALSTLGCSESPTVTARFRNPAVPSERRVSELLRLMRPEEKLALLQGVRSQSFAGIDRLGIPPLGVVQGAMGISARSRFGGMIPATAFPANIGMAATWDTGLMEQVGGAIAQQAIRLGRSQILGPVTEVASSPLSGRVFETYGEDPFLVSRMVSSYVSGVQGEGGIATAIYGAGSPDQRTAHQLNLRPLEAAVVEAGVWSVMPRPDADAAVPRFLYGALGFRGFALAPNDGSELPAHGSELPAIDDRVRGVLRAMFASGAFDRAPSSPGELEKPAHRVLARAAAEESIVVLKNDHNLLPLDPTKVRSLAVLGPNAAQNRMASGSFTVAARYSATPLDALRAVFGSRVITGGGTVAEAAKTAAAADVAVVFAGTGAATEAETHDRTGLALPSGQDELIAAVAKANPRTIVVGIAGAPFATDQWLDKVPAVLDAWFPGEEGGTAIADILTGVVNPSGRLPMAFPAQIGGNATPAFPFGFGLSWTHFEYSDLAVNPPSVAPGQFTEVEVSLTVRNSGKLAGKETVQLYVYAAPTNIPRPEQQLRGFEQVELRPGESRRVRFLLFPTATAFFTERGPAWRQDQTEFEVRVGSSSRDIRVTGNFSITE